jgi:CDP-diacylglycerol--glycerol-3-phosphate 3-phosphatidyltransferase
MFINVPNILTLFRILMIPPLVGVFFVDDILLTPVQRGQAATLFFVVASVTDFFDGWAARKLGQVTPFGAFLDPVADKLIVTASLAILLHVGHVNPLVAFIIIGREITISALREWMAQIGASQSVAVSFIGKLKTTAQMTAIPMLLYYQPVFGVSLHRVGTWLIYAAAILTVWSMVYYMGKAWPAILARTAKVRTV